MIELKEIELLFNSIPTACIILKPDRPDYTIASANRFFLSGTYTALSELVGRPFFEAFPSNFGDDGTRTLKILEAFAHVLNHKTPFLIKQHRYDLVSAIDSVEHIRYWDIETYPLLDQEGQIMYIVQSSTDVTALFEAEKKLEENSARIITELRERKEIERALELSNERYNYVNKATNDAIYDWDITIDNIHWGEAFFRLFGYAEDKLFPLTKWASMVHPDDRLPLEQSLDKTLQDPQQNNWRAEYRFKRSDGSYAFIEENGYILREEPGKATRMIGVLRDVSERKLAEAEIQSAKDTYSDLFDLSPLPMWVYDLESFIFLDVNRAAITHYGYTKEEFLSMSVLDIRPKEEAAILIDTVRNEVKPGWYHTSEVRHTKKSGEIIQVSARGNSIHFGTKKARVVVAIDTTEKIKSEQALSNSERRFKTLIQGGSDLIAIVEIDGYCKYVSPNIQRVLGIAQQDFIGRNVFNFIYEEDREFLMHQFLLLNRKRQHEVAPFRYVDKQGVIHWIETVITDMRDDEAIGGIVCNSRIVTERVENQLKVKKHLDRYNIVSKATSDSIWDLDMTSGSMLWNHGIKAIFGYKEVNSNYKWWYDHVHPDDVKAVAQIVEDSVRNKISRWTSEYRFKCANDSYKYVLDRGFLIFDEHSGQPLRMIGAMQDISEQVAYTKALEAHNTRLKEIAWTQSHLVRAPLARILGLIPLLNNPDNDEKTRETVLSYLNTSAHDLDNIIMEVIGKSHEALKNI